MFILGKWDRLRSSVHRRARCKDESFNTGYAGRLEQMECPSDICIVIEPGVLNRGSNACARSQMCDDVNFLAVKQISHRFAVAKIDMANGYIPGKTGNVLVLDLRIVKIVEIVQDDDFMPDNEQLLNQMRPDKAGAACDQDSHGAKLATDGHGWTQISQLASSLRRPYI